MKNLQHLILLLSFALLCVTSCKQEKETEDTTPISSEVVAGEVEKKKSIQDYLGISFNISTEDSDDGLPKEKISFLESLKLFASQFASAAADFIPESLFSTEDKLTKNDMRKGTPIDASYHEYLRLMEWYKACHAMGDTFVDLDFTLNGNVNLSGFTWEPIGSWDFPYTGKFNGNGYRITGIFVDSSFDSGFFRAVGKGGVVSDLHLEGIVTGKGVVGGIAGFNIGGTIEGCSFSNGMVVNYWSITVGGIVGSNYEKGRILGCVVRNSEIGHQSGGSVGGIVGANNLDCVVAACLVDGGILGNIKNNYSSVGGVTYRNNSQIIACLAAPDQWGESRSPGSAGIAYLNEARGYVHYSLWNRSRLGVLTISEEKNRDPQEDYCRSFTFEDSLVEHINSMNANLQAARIPWRWSIPTAPGKLSVPYKI